MAKRGKIMSARVHEALLVVLKARKAFENAREAEKTALTAVEEAEQVLRESDDYSYETAEQQLKEKRLEAKTAQDHWREMGAQLKEIKGEVIANLTPIEVALLEVELASALATEKNAAYAKAVEKGDANTNQASIEAGQAQEQVVKARAELAKRQAQVQAQSLKPKVAPIAPTQAATTPDTKPPSPSGSETSNTPPKVSEQPAQQETSMPSDKLNLSNQNVILKKPSSPTLPSNTALVNEPPIHPLTPALAALAANKTAELNTFQNKYKGDNKLWNLYSPSNSFSFGKKTRLKQIKTLQDAINNFTLKDPASIKNLETAILNCANQLVEETRFTGESKLEKVLTELNKDFSTLMGKSTPLFDYQKEQGKKKWGRSPKLDL